MFRQHKILCENKEVTIYLFLYDQEIDLETMKNIFSQISTITLEARIIDYFNQNNIKCLANHVKIVYHATIVKDFMMHQHYRPTTYATNVVSLYQ
ncbi:MAG: hypothetical protein UIL36_05095 [Turicibacter sp.]|nr:hypothetical protein [Turicibacter sp.]MEE0880962.1 hypothetical protein [Turicibacter sp.]MEE1238128.1 hypothetical protein [Turicibacter sp.]